MNSGKPVNGAVVIPIDINANGQADPGEYLQTKAEALQAVADGNYPSPPARLLYLVTNGKPTGLVQAFITWVLTDGQAYVAEAGYIQLTPAQLQEALQKME
jgi:phosphate transport system substrate-binding protein